jgi:GAF domain-containing protein
MSSDSERPAGDLAEAQRKIEQQAQEIERLRAQLADQSFAEALREALRAAAGVGIVAAPLDHDLLLQSIVETAGDVLGVEAGSLFLLDDEREELVFQVAVGGAADKVRQFRVPLGRGFAGYVAATGQPLAVTNAAEDPRFAREIADAVGYRPSTILCVPLYLRDRVIGVLELLNKVGGVPFTPRDIDTLSRFGRLAALAIDHSLLTQDLRRLFRALLADAVEDQRLIASSRRFAEHAASAVEHSRAMRLAGLAHELSRQGDEAQQLAIEVLDSVARYVTGRHRPLG